MPVARAHVTRALVTVVLCLGLVGCGGLRESHLNPFNWFKRSEARAIVAVETAGDARAFVETVLTMTVEPIPGGAIVRATGLPPTQGWWQAELVALPVTESGTLVYEFRLLPPTDQTPAGNPRSREVEVAVYISDFKLEAISEIVVQGSTNARSARR